MNMIIGNRSFANTKENLHFKLRFEIDVIALGA